MPEVIYCVNMFGIFSNNKCIFTYNNRNSNSNTQIYQEYVHLTREGETEYG